jgi:hypothetical protein
MPTYRKNTKQFIIKVISNNFARKGYNSSFAYIKNQTIPKISIFHSINVIRRKYIAMNIIDTMIHFYIISTQAVLGMKNDDDDDDGGGGSGSGGSGSSSSSSNFTT